MQEVSREAGEVEEKLKGTFGEEKVEGEVGGEAVVTLEENVEC